MSVPNYERFDLTQLATVQALGRQLVFALRKGEDATRLDDAGAAFSITPPVQGVYLLLVCPTRYQPIFKDVRNWYDEQSAFYVGEADNLRKRLMEHRLTFKKMVEGEIAAQRLIGDAPRIVEDSVYFTYVELAGTNEASARHERLLVEALLVAALRPIANDLGFGTGRLGEDEMWTLLGPLPPKRFAEALEERDGDYMWPVGEWGTQQEQGEFTSADPKSPGEAWHMSDEELDAYELEYERLLDAPQEDSERLAAQEEVNRRGRTRRLPPIDP